MFFTNRCDANKVGLKVTGVTISLSSVSHELDTTLLFKSP